MAAEYIGVICGALSGRAYAVINPDDDGELDNPRLLLLKILTENPDQREPLAMVRVPRREYQSCLSMDDVMQIVARLTKPT